MRSANTRPELACLAALNFALAACGKSIRHVGDRPEPRDASVDDASIDPDPTNPCVRRPPITEPAVNCAYPLAPLPNPPAVENVATLGQQNCRYRFGEPRVVPVSGLHTQYAFSFDVNGDGAGDIFAWTEMYGAGGLTLAVSSVENGVLSYHRVDCDALKQIPWGRVFVRDVNRDGVPDLVVGTSTYDLRERCEVSEPSDAGMQVFMNLPSGFVEVLHHEWPDPGSTVKTAVLDVVVGDFDRNQACIDDVAFGYDRLSFPGSTCDVEFGAELLLSHGTWPDLGHEVRNWQNWEGGRTLGDLAASTRPELFVTAAPGLAPGTIGHGGLLLAWNEGELVERVARVEAPTSMVFYEGPFDAWLAPFAGVPHALVLLYERDLVFYDLTDPGKSPLPVLFTRPLLGLHRVDRELGGAPGAFTRFLLDLEGDGDLDFIEYPQPSSPPGQHRLAIHRSQDGAEFAEAQVFEAGNLDLVPESPFVPVGAAKGALIVNDDKSLEFPLSVRALECAPE